MTGAKTNERPGTRAQVRYLRMSASKARVVLDLIRGKSVTDANQILHFSERGAAKEIQKVLRSAVANAQHNDEQSADELFVSACFADEGPTLKRFRPRARGRAGRIHKQTCHITLIVSRMDEDVLDRMRDKAAGRTSTGTSDRRARVAKSRGDEVVETEAVESEAVETIVDDAAEEAPVSEVESTTIDSDSDGAVNADDESPYGSGSHALVDGDPEIMPDGFPVKGNDGSKLYHNEDSPFYGRTKAEVWFKDDAAAEAAGFSKPESQQKKEAAADEAAAEDDAPEAGDA
jgi:large subunit ribosomal protein L22